MVEWVLGILENKRYFFFQRPSGVTLHFAASKQLLVYCQVFFFNIKDGFQFDDTLYESMEFISKTFTLEGQESMCGAPRIFLSNRKVFHGIGKIWISTGLPNVLFFLDIFAF
jgi:hypothetical protein